VRRQFQRAKGARETDLLFVIDVWPRSTTTAYFAIAASTASMSSSPAVRAGSRPAIPRQRRPRRMRPQAIDCEASWNSYTEAGGLLSRTEVMRNSARVES
jgi:hypothetical protein